VLSHEIVDLLVLQLDVVLLLLELDQCRRERCWKSCLPFEMNLGSAMDARLQTAVSSGAEYSMTSVQRLDDLIVPRFFWLDLAAGWLASRK
jgi:hypothetical protein